MKIDDTTLSEPAWNLEGMDHNVQKYLQLPILHIVWALLVPTKISKQKQQFGTQLHVTLLSFHTIIV